MEERLRAVRARVRSFPDFPVPGVLFRCVAGLGGRIKGLGGRIKGWGWGRGWRRGAGDGAGGLGMEE